MKRGIVSKIESLSAVDGPGLRAVVFTVGCPWRCGYCHNPETQGEAGEEDLPAEELAAKLARFAPYLGEGGYTFSGGEPLLHAAYLSRVVDLLRPTGLSFAMETSGSPLTEEGKRLVEKMDLVIADVKAADDEAYRSLTGGLTLARVLEFLHFVSALNKRLWVRQVVVPGYNDGEENVKKLGDLVRPFHPERIELLPFRKLCTEKYRELNREFPFGHYTEMDGGRVKELEKLLKE